MVVFSSLRPLLSVSTFGLRNAVLARTMSDHRVMALTPSRWQWTKFKDFMHFYVMLGLIPCGLIILYSNVFVGPATLSETPADYVPKYWEYYRHPITRFLAQHYYNNPQQDYEKFLHHLYETEERRKLRVLEKQVKNLMGERRDYQAYYYRPIMAKYQRATAEAAELVRSLG